jgi:serine/threonine protein kinase/tetratricopeptide (TPR) repeat protein
MSEPASEQSLFLHALGLPTTADRAAYLDEACLGNPRLRADLDALLAAHDRLGAGLPLTTGQEPAGAVPPGSGPAPGGVAGDDVGAVLSGRYKLLEQIGEGGMGTVWMAEQTEPVQRRVAVKVIKEGMDSRQVLARFEAERQALALMEHPNIARVLDAGRTPSSRPYFVMELVKGQPITKYCDDKRLGVRERLDLFGDVCRALQHAHQKGIIHRDIKPSNVLVAPYDGKPVVKVIDFGVAKATGQRLTDKTLFTGFGALVGTPEYMSPEQAEVNNRDIDTRSDIYSLGVLLYELLTGSTPLTRKRIQEAALLEVLRVIREEEPPRPSTRLSESRDSLPSISAQRQTEPAKLTKLVRGELDWLVMKALEKDRNRRYETAKGFADDVQRYLADEAVLACPPSAWYRFRKFARRNRTPMTVAAIVAAAVVLGILGTTWQAIRATRERDRAEGNFRQAKKAVDDFYTSISETTLLDKPGLQPLRKELLDRALKYYQDLLAQRGNGPQLQAEIASAYLRIFMIDVATSSWDEAFAALQAGLENAEKLIEDHPEDAELQTRLAGFWNVERLLYCGRTSGAEPSNLLQAMRTLKKGAETWDKLARTHPTVPGFQNDLAAFSTYIGDFSWGFGRQAEALRAYEKASEIREKLVSTYPHSREYRAALGESRNGLAWMLHHNSRRQEAEKACREAIVLQEQLVAEFPQVPNYRVILANCYHTLGIVLRATGRHQEALKASRSELQITERLTADFPDVPAFESEAAFAYRSLGEALVGVGEHQEPERLLRRSIGIYEKLASKLPNISYYEREQGWTYLTLANLLAATGRPQEAEKTYHQVLAIFEKYVAQPNYLWEVNDIRRKLITVRKAQGRS